MNDIDEVINAIVVLRQNNIDFKILESIVFNIHNGPGPRNSGYSNNKNITQWKQLYEECAISLSEEQVQKVFKYFKERYSNHFFKLDKNYAVLRNFNPDLQDEKIIYKTIEIWESKNSVK